MTGFKLNAGNKFATSKRWLRYVYPMLRKKYGRISINTAAILNQYEITNSACRQCNGEYCLAQTQYWQPVLNCERGLNYSLSYRKCVFSRE